MNFKKYPFFNRSNREKESFEFKQMKMDSNKWSVRQLFGLFDQNQDGLIDAQDIVAVCTLPNTLVNQVN